MSPDGKKEVSTHNGLAHVIDLDTGIKRTLSGHLFTAEWSPDGKWLAALEEGERGRTILFDAKDLTPKRTLEHSELAWSPDSRYLLGLKTCNETFATIEIIDIETGRRTVVQSSKCKVNQATLGWVSSPPISSRGPVEQASRPFLPRYSLAFLFHERASDQNLVDAIHP